MGATVKIGFVLAACMVVGWPACAQESVPVRWTLAASAAEGAPVGRGSAVTARLHAAVESGWHIYSLHEEPGGPTALRISVPPQSTFAISGDVGAPPPKSAIDPGFDMETHFYTGDVDLTIPLRATRKTAGPVAVDVFYQACNRETCLRPTVAHLTAPVTKGQEGQR